jgi:DNA polymerase III delta prime subunit
MAFIKAVKHESKLRLAIAGPSGSGKTYTSLAIASELGGPVAVVDTEHGSASKYADLFEFDVMELSAPFHPDRYVQAIIEAADDGYRVIVLDSLTHAWNGTGGMLDIVDEIAKRNRTPNTFAAWKDATPIQNRLTEGIVSAPIHVIATIRSKQDYSQDKDANGKTVIKKVGMAPIQRDGFEYEFDVFFDMDIDNNAIVTKTRCPALTGRVIKRPGADVAEILNEWLHGAPAPVRVIDTTTGEIHDTPKHTNGATNGNGHHEQPADIPAKVAEWLNQSKPADVAKAWAVESGAQSNEHAARNSLKKIVDADFGGTFNKSNMASALTAFYFRQLEHLAEGVEEVAVETVEAAAF